MAEDNPENGRMPEKQALLALKEAEPPRIAFEDLDFNFGERWIPTGVYAAYMSHLFDTQVSIAYSAQHGRIFGGMRYEDHENHGRVFSEGILPQL